MKSNLRLSDIATYVTDKISSSDILLEEHVTTYCVLQNKRGWEIATNLSPAEWLQISGVEIRLRNIGRELNIPKVHPHKFRRTLATMAIDNIFILFFFMFQVSFL